MAKKCKNASRGNQTSHKIKVMAGGTLSGGVEVDEIYILVEPFKS